MEKEIEVLAHKYILHKLAAVSVVFLVPPIGQSIRLNYMAVPWVIKMKVKCVLWCNI